MERSEVVALILEARKAKGLKWKDLAAKVGKSKEWVTAGCLGQMTFNAEQAGVLVELLGCRQRQARLYKRHRIADRYRQLCRLTH